MIAQPRTCTKLLHRHKETKHKTYAHCLLWYMLYCFFYVYKMNEKRCEQEREREKYEISIGQFCLRAVSSSVSLLPISIFNGSANGKTGDRTTEHTHRMYNVFNVQCMSVYGHNGRHGFFLSRRFSLRFFSSLSIQSVWKYHWSLRMYTLLCV